MSCRRWDYCSAWRTYERCGSSVLASTSRISYQGRSRRRASLPSTMRYSQRNPADMARLRALVLHNTDAILKQAAVERSLLWTLLQRGRAYRSHASGGARGPRPQCLTAGCFGPSAQQYENLAKEQKIAVHGFRLCRIPGDLDRVSATGVRHVAGGRGGLPVDGDTGDGPVACQCGPGGEGCADGVAASLLLYPPPGVMFPANT